MSLTMLRKITILALGMVLCACSGRAPNQNASDPSGTASVETSGGNAANTDNSDASEPSGNDAGGNNGDADCGGHVCEAGQSCIEYYGFAGNRLYVCGIPCETGAPNDGCPDGMECQVIPDGPTQCK